MSNLSLKRLAPAAALVSLCALAGCSTTSGGGGAVSAASAGFFAPLPSSTGTRPADARQIISELNGGIIGPVVGKRLGDSDRTRALEAEYRALETAPSGQAVAWQGRNDRVSGEVVAAAPYTVGSQNCRQYSHAVTIDGTAQTAKGVACRNPDGSWTPLS